MIVAIKDNEIIGIDKSLLFYLDTNLENLSEKISAIKLAISSIEKSPLTIDNKLFEVKEIEFLTLENIKLYDLSPKEEISFEPVTESQPSFEPVTESQPSKEEKSIVLTFEDEFKEIDDILNLTPKEIKELLKKELKEASEELGVDNETINELFEALLEQIKQNKNEFYNAIREENYDKLHKLAHSLKGASLNLRLSNLALILKYIDEKSKEKIPINKLELLINKFYKFVDKINEKTEEETPTLNIDETTKQLILMTIENYLKTQNEKQFKKDLKYIQKILGIQISDINELQEIVKGMK